MSSIIAASTAPSPSSALDAVLASKWPHASGSELPVGGHGLAAFERGRPGVRGDVAGTQRRAAPARSKREHRRPPPGGTRPRRNDPGAPPWSNAVSTPMRRSTGSAKRDPGAIETGKSYGSIQSRSGPNEKAAGRPKGGRIETGKSWAPSQDTAASSRRIIIREKNREENIVTVCYQSTTVYDTVRQQCMIPSGNSSQALW